jgi:hypothetical protein
MREANLILLGKHKSRRRPANRNTLNEPKEREGNLLALLGPGGNRNEVRPCESAISSLLTSEPAKGTAQIATVKAISRTPLIFYDQTLRLESFNRYETSQLESYNRCQAGKCALRRVEPMKKFTRNGVNLLFLLNIDQLASREKQATLEIAVVQGILRSGDQMRVI